MKTVEIKIFCLLKINKLIAGTTHAWVTRMWNMNVLEERIMRMVCIQK